MSCYIIVGWQLEGLWNNSCNLLLKGYYSTMFVEGSKLQKKFRWLYILTLYQNQHYINKRCGQVVEKNPSPPPPH